MKKRGMAIGLAALVVVCAAYAGVNAYVGHAQKKKEAQDKAKEVYMTDYGDIIAVSYDHEGKTLSFTKTGDTWGYDGDKEFPLMQSKLTVIENTAKKLMAVRKLEGGDPLSAYGLDKPVRKVTVRAQDGNDVTILIGNGTEDGNHYAMIQGQDTPYLIGSSLFDETSYGLDDLIQLEEFPMIQGTSIQDIAITKDGKTQHYVKKKLDDKGTIAWYKDSASSEANKVKDNASLNTLADSLATLTVKKCADYKTTSQDLGKYGLTEPMAVIKYTYEDGGKTKSLTLAVGNMTEDKSAYYTRKDDSKMVNEMDKKTIDKCLDVNVQAEAGATSGAGTTSPAETTSGAGTTSPAKATSGAGTGSPAKAASGAGTGSPAQ